MGSIASLRMRGVDVFSWKNDVDPTFLFLFTAEDVLREDRNPEQIDDYDNPRATVLVSTAGHLIDRLDFLGVGQAAAQAAFQRNLSSKLSSAISVRDLLENEPDLVQTQIDFLTGLTFSRWLILTTASLSEPRSFLESRWQNPTSLDALLSLWEDDDPRLLLRALLSALQPNEEVRLDVSDLIYGGWLDEPFDPQSVAKEHFSYAMINGNPAVVITEGSSDARLLRAAVEVRHPHLVSYLRFLDFGDGAEGSAAAGIRTMKSFAAAGISNRVILLLDNDSAARDALRSLRSTLPAHYSVIHYPHLALAEEYPTLGPTGMSVMDVNGLAASVEMYLGTDVLLNADGGLTPVQWSAYLHGVRAYQGELTDKKRIQERFLGKVDQTRSGHVNEALHDWSGIDAIVAALRRVLTSQPVRPGYRHDG